MAVEVGISSLKKTAAEHRSRADALGDVESAHLLLFYAVECGMKAALLRRSRGRGTSDLGTHLRTHNLRDLARELRLGGELQKWMGPCARRDGGTVDVRELHEAWRYGAKLESAGERDVVAGLRALADWCEQECG